MRTRVTAHLIVVALLLASGRLLACGWECLDELAVTADASCHEASVPDRRVSVAKVGAAPHACRPDAIELRMTMAKPPAAHAIVAAPPIAAFMTGAWSIDSSRDRRLLSGLRPTPPHSPAPSVLRI